MRVLAIAFRFIVLWSWNQDGRKENATYSIFGYDYCSADSAVVGTKCPQSILILNFPGAGSVDPISCL